MHYHEYASLSDGQRNASKMANCRGDNIKYLMSVKSGEETEISNNIKCPNILGASLNGYMQEYLQRQMSKCAKYK